MRFVGKSGSDLSAVYSCFFSRSYVIYGDAVFGMISFGGSDLGLDKIHLIRLD